MARIQTYVFLDLETTGLPRQELNKTRITELSLVAVRREHVRECRPGASPRVQNKLTLCLNPGRYVDPDSTLVTGLCNDLLEHEPPFNRDVFTTIDTFLRLQRKPVCLVAQNGHNFDYPIIKAHLVKLNVSLDQDLWCADSLHGFHDILELKKDHLTSSKPGNVEQSVIQETEISKRDETDGQQKQSVAIMMMNETTPKRKPVVASQRLKNIKNGPCHIGKTRRKLFWEGREKPQDSYKLAQIYRRVLNKSPIEAHRAENDCILALECAVAIPEFVTWVDENCTLFSDVKPMMVGVPLGQ